jgi:hypothetical protein
MAVKADATFTRHEASDVRRFTDAAPSSQDELRQDELRQRLPDYIAACLPQR